MLSHGYCFPVLFKFDILQCISVVYDSKLWMKIIRSLKVSVDAFMTNHCEDVVELIATDKTDLKVSILLTSLQGPVRCTAVI